VLIPIVSFIGKSNSGKTTLLEKVVRELKSAGYRVALIKHSHHDFDIDQPGKDTWRLAQAGSDVVAISSPNKVALIERVDTELTLTQIEALFGGRVDIVLTEGYKNSPTPQIVVLAAEQGGEQLYRQEEPLATVPASRSSRGVPQFDNYDVANVVDLLIAQIGNGSGEKPGSSSPPSHPTTRWDVYQSDKLEELLAESTALHGHICPGQVLGVRMAMRGCQELGIEKPKEEAKRLVVYVEIDRCATDAIQTVTGCKLGKRTMKYVDYGKLAATFIDLPTGKAVRLAAREEIREKAAAYRHQRWTKHEAEVAAYKVMPDEELFHIEHVLVEVPIEDLPGPPLRRVICDQCGEGINDSREITVAGRTLCRPCAYGGYFRRHTALGHSTSPGYHQPGLKVLTK
jgi:formylmethanofuran dehydrogenase subunit E